MNLTKIKKSTTIMAIGYLCIIISLFYCLTNVGFTYAIFFAFLMIPGYALLTIGEGLIRKENKLFKASFIVSLCLDFIFLINVTIALVAQYQKVSSELKESLEITSLILQALLNALVAITSCLFADGLKETFIKLNNVPMKTYSWIMKFGVSKLIIILVALPTIKITSISAVAMTTITIVLGFVIETSLFVYTIISSYQLNKKNS